MNKKEKFEAVKGNKLKIEDANKHISIVDFDDIYMVEADGNDCNIYAVGASFNMIRGNLSYMEKQIRFAGCSHKLLRVCKSYIINTDFLKDLDVKKGKLTLTDVCKPNDEITIGVKPAYRLRKALDGEHKSALPETHIEQSLLNIEVEDLNDTHEFEVGEEYVDLGLTSRTLWAIGNVCVQSKLGVAHYGWGQLYLNDRYDGDGYWQTPSELQDVEQLPLEYDVARQEWGGGWQMPTEEDFEELCKECSMRWCIVGEDRVHGVLFTGRNGRRLFLPAGGMKNGNSWEPVREKHACYWTGTNRPHVDRKAVSAVFYDIDEEEASAVLGTEDWCRGLAVRPVLKERTSPEAPRVKTELKVCPFTDVLDSKGFYMAVANHGWRFGYLNIPVDPVKALALIKKTCEEHSVDVVVGFGVAAFLVHQLKGYKRICVNPDFHPSESYPVGTHNYGLNECTDEENFEITDEIHQHFLDMEAHQFDNVDDDCWGVFKDIYSDEADEFCEHYSQQPLEIPKLGKANDWACVVLVPLIKQISK